MSQAFKLLSNKNSYLFLLILISVNISYAQRTISGSVIDVVSGEALIGINIHIPNTKINTQTDFQGFYNLNIPNDATELIVAPTENYTGQTVSIGTNDTLDIALKESTSFLDRYKCFCFDKIYWE